MYKGLSPWAIGVKPTNLDETIQSAVIGGFDGVEINVHEVADLADSIGAEAVRAKFEAAGIVPAGFGLPVDFRGDFNTYQKELNGFERLVKAAAAIGCKSTSTWIMPCSNELNFDQNRRFHVERFKPIAEILRGSAMLLGLEFIGPKTLRDSRRFPFIYTMEAMLDMGADIDNNVGILLDCWHWHTSGGTVDELLKLSPEQIAYVHVNDAPAGTEMDAHQDHIRGLPGETGVIDIKGFLGALQSVGYEGAVTPEPFADLSGLATDADRLKLVGASMEKIFAMI